MTPDRWEQLKDLLDEALSLTGVDRNEFLEAEIERDTSVGRELELLLSKHASAGNFLGGEDLSDEPDKAGIEGSVMTHFKVLEKIGEGGMGIVYKARDLELRRYVALKLLSDHAQWDQNALKRLELEAMTASALNHPNICTIHSIEKHDGLPFIVMELLQGRTLRDRIGGKSLNIDTVVQISLQLAEALDAAHSRSIMHRDIKPTNIFVSDKSHAKLLDFGLAKRSRLVSTTSDLDDISGVVSKGCADDQSAPAGTLAYMSPEQLQGHEVDRCSDLFSLGSVMYEMVTGNQPFTGPTSAAVMQAIIGKRLSWPSKPGADPRIMDIIEKALEKDREFRYSSARHLVTDLRRLKRDLDVARNTYSTRLSSPLQLIKGSIALLPFKDLSPESDQAFFCDGIVEELINTLTRIEGLHVTGMTSAFTFRTDEPDFRDIAAQLRVENVLVGSVRKMGNRIRVSARLIRTQAGNAIWAENYDREIGDIFVVQDDLARSIVKALTMQLIETDERFISKGTGSQRSYDWYLKGRFEWNKRTYQAFKESIRLYALALKEDPKCGLAYAGLADSYYTLADYGHVSCLVALQKAKDAALRAISLDANLASAHASLGLIHTGFDYDRKSAGEEFRTAIALNPGGAGARHFYGLYLAWAGQFDEALLEIERAQEIEPLSPGINYAHPTILVFARKPEKAIAEFKAMAARVPDFFGWYLGLGDAYLQLAMFPEAEEALQRASTLSSHLPQITGMLGNCYARWGRTTEALALLKELTELTGKQHVSTVSFLLIYLGLDDREQIFQCLEKAYNERSTLLVRLKVDHKVDALRSDPRFIDLLRRIDFN